ncbi:Y-family DNA polymerase [Bdellovibrionota bacterium]
MKRERIALVDANAFYCSCEILFQPKYLGKPVVVLSNNDGCVISKTREAKRLGVKTGQPFFEIKALCKKHDVAVFSSNFSLYTNVSDRMMIVLEGMTDSLEQYSVDEAFLSLNRFKDDELYDYGKKIKSAVGQQVGLPVSVGIGPTKTLAKAANYLAKNRDELRGVADLTCKKDQDRFLASVPIGEIWGIGPASTRKLLGIGVRTAKQFRDYPNEWFILRLLTKVGLQTKKELMGIACFPIEKILSRKKEIISSRTFGRAVTSESTLRESVASYTSLAMEKLRKQNSVCSSLSVWVRTNPFQAAPQFYGFETEELLTGTLDTCKAIGLASKALSQMYRPGFEYKKAGVLLSNIADKNGNQLNFFESVDTPKVETLMATMDAINAKEGPHTVKSASCGTDNEAWRMQRNFKSPRYTTSWREIPKVG